VAAPVGYIAKAIAKALLSGILPELKDILKVLVCILLIPLLLILFLFSAPLVIHQRIPIAAPKTARMYSDMADSVSRMTSSPCDDGVNVQWQQVIAVDTVRFEQDFSEVNSKIARETAEEFVEEDGTCTH